MAKQSTCRVKLMQNVQPASIRDLSGKMLYPHIVFVLISLVGTAFFSTTLIALARFSWNSDTYSHIMIIPLVTLGLIYTKATVVFANTRYAPGVGLPVLLLGLLIHYLGLHHTIGLSPNDARGVAIFGVLAFYLGGFITSYGVQAFKEALFPILMLLFMIPLPDSLYEMVVGALQSSSAEAADLIFRMTGVPMLRDGFVMSLPGLSIEVAKECSGIRSGLSLFILSLLYGHLFLESHKNRVLLAILAVLIAVFKNGLRIVTLSLLAVYVDMRIIDSDFHRKGGIPFFAMAFAMLTLVLYLLRKTEAHRAKVATNGSRVASGN